MRILYIYDFPNWALHNVGKYWARVLGAEYPFVFVRLREHAKYSPDAFDYVFWGCSAMAREGRRERLKHLVIPRDPAVWRPDACANSITVIHDPCNIFPQRGGWQKAKPRLDHLKSFSKVAVASNEMQSILRDLGYDCSIINTNSLLELRNAAEIQPEPLKVFTKCNRYRRKNLALFRGLQRSHRRHCDRFDGYIGRTVLPEPEYIRLIEEHNCYICTSWQEGGPLPLMDAMRRGCAVLTTPVGQTDELVVEGYSGFFCRTRDEFAARIELLANDSRLLYQMRCNSLKISAERSDERVRSQLMAFLDSK